MSLDDLYEYYQDQPCEVTLETQAVCNAACTFCPYPTIERKGQKMSDALLDKILTELRRFDRPFIVSPFKLSDPLLDVRLPDILRRIKNETRAMVRIFTNGSALTPKNAEMLAGFSNILEVWVSLNATNKEDYERIMGLNFEKVTGNLDWLHGKVFPHKVRIGKVGHPDEGFRNYVYERWPDFEPVVIKKDAWIDFTDPEYPNVPDAPCSRWFELSIMADGRVTHCCMTSGDDRRYDIGDINNQTLLEVYNSPLWKERRAGMISRKTINRDTSPCAVCAY